MTGRKALALAVVLAAAATGTFVPLAMKRAARSVRPLSEPESTDAPPFDREQSAALFVGVRKFTHDGIEEVPFAVDDAVDLAYEFTFDPRTQLVPANRVVLALSGHPAKPESQQRLRELKEAGAQIESAHPSDILAALYKQTALAGKGGVLILSLATHGFTRDGVTYILGASSLLRDPETNLPVSKLLDIVAAADARRSVVFIDACRERLSGGSRGVSGPPAAPLATLYGRMKRVHGQAVFYAAAAGQYAYDGDGNGVFTKAVLEGLRCHATAPRGVVTAETLGNYVEHNVRDWIRKNRHFSAGTAIQCSFDGEAKNMPLAFCWGRPAPPSAGMVASLSYDRATLSALAPNGMLLWRRGLESEISHSEVVDLDGDGQREVVVSVRTGIIVFDSAGRPLWSAREEGMPLRAVLTADLFRKHTREVVAVWEGPSSSRLSLYAPSGEHLAHHDFQGRLSAIAVDRPTTRHARKIIAAGIDAAGAAVVCLFHPKKIEDGPEWSRRVGEKIVRIKIEDVNHDGHNDIVAETASGARLVLDFDGKLLGSQR